MVIPVLYASQTGTCAHLARLLHKEMGDLFKVIAINRFDFQYANSFSFIVFIVSTHGDGGCPFNMAKLWDILSEHPRPIFHFEFAVLAVGSSSFERYNWCGKILFEKLGAFGARGLIRTLADSRAVDGVYGGFSEFVVELKRIIADKKLELMDKEVVKRNDFIIEPVKYKAKLVSRELITAPGYDQRIYELVFVIPEYCDFRPGDCIGFIPFNTPALLMNLNCTENEREYLKQHADLLAPPRQPLFHLLAEMADTPLLKNKLKSLAVDFNEYFEYVSRPKRTIFEVLDDFGIKPTYSLLRQLEPIYPRYYSCARVSGNFHILVRDVRYKTTLQQPRMGLCCEYLKNTLEVGDVVTVEVTQSRLFLEEKQLLFFSTGTGITLPRSVVHFYRGKRIRIYQGFRKYRNDQLCVNEFKNCEVYPAASVDDKNYVMDVYKENPVTNIEDWLVFVSGNTRVNKEIRRLLREVHGEDVPFQSETW